MVARVLLSVACLSLSSLAFAGSLKGKIMDKNNHSSLPYSTILLEDAAGKKWMATADGDGRFAIAHLPDGTYQMTVSYVGYHTERRTLTVSGQATTTVRLTADASVLDEVVVTARESQGITSSSLIDRKAIEHLQPSSFTDLLSLLPGGSTSLPALTSANSIRLRQVGSGGSGYDISSMGTVFITDGIPLNTNANMQQVRQATSSASGDPDAGRNHVTTGVDMRSIPTDNIESVEIIRGIAPVEYGDLTSGVVLIRRKLKATPFEARFKADSYSKLLSAGKGMEFGRFVLNLGIDYLDAKADPRNALTNYRRATFSARMQDSWSLGGYSLRWRSNVDYTGSFDNEKHDPEILKQKDDRYRSSYNRMSMSQQLVLLKTQDGSVVPGGGSSAGRQGFLFKSLSLDVAAAYESSRISQDKSINLSRDIAASTTLADGEHDGTYLPYHYLAHVTVDGRPLNLYAKLKGLFGWTTGRLEQRFNVGAEWKMDKNYGHGQQYDPALPITPGTAYRPRVYSDIPASHLLSVYAQDGLVLPLGGHRLQADVGVRAMQLLNLDTRYAMHGRWYADPRLNVQWRLPAIKVGNHKLVVDLNGGWGRQTKFPTLLQLYPDKLYNDLIELNYYDLNPDYRRLHLRTYVIDPTNYDLQPARNDKWEVRLGANYNGNNFSVTWFRESMNDGFRSTGVAQPFSYRDYDEGSIASGTLSAPPALETLPYEQKTVLNVYGRVTNGSRLVKEGLEYQFSTRRFEAIKTRFTLNGAYFKTTYANSQPMFQTNTTAVVEGVPVNNLYVGFYDNSSGLVQEQLNTNLMADTYLPRLGLAFSLTAECTWFTMAQTMRENGVPTAYMATDGQVYPYTEESRNDPYLQWLERKYNDTSWQKQRVPLWMFLNLKVTKDFGRWMKLALFIDRMIDYMPDYQTISGMTVRRTSKPYFGMEMNIKI